jgi:urea transporter
MIQSSKQITKLSFQGLANSYAQLFLSTNPITGLFIVIASFIDPVAGSCGLAMTLLTNAIAYLFHLNQSKIQSGSIGYNALLTGLFIGHTFTWSPYLMLVILTGSILSLMLTVSIENWLSKKSLPFLSLPFLLNVWLLKLATAGLSSLDPNLNELYVFNHLYRVGGEHLLNTYLSIEQIPIPTLFVVYFKSLGAVLFQHSLLAGLLVSIGILIHSRIAFTLSILSFLSGYFFYQIIGANMNDLNYSFIGFNFILSGMALGAFFLIPNFWSYLLALLIAPSIAIIGIGAEKILSVFQLPLLSLPFNLFVILFLFFLYFREKAKFLHLTTAQFASPEKNLYSYQNKSKRFAQYATFKIRLPIFGSMRISQGHEGKITHLSDWKYAWDFDATDAENRTYRLPGILVDDYYCYNLPVIAPAAGTVVKVVDHVKDNAINQVNLSENWGNTVIIQHAPYLFSKLSHLKQGSIKVFEGEWVEKGRTIGAVGNSGRSPEPHLHFQLQSTPYIGSKTLNFPISNFIQIDDKGFHFKKNGIPKEGLWVENPVPNKLLAEAMSFTPGKKYTWQLSENQESEIWESHSDAYNNRYIYDTKSQSYLYFSNDNELFESLSFYGNKNTLLFHFYLATQQILLSFYQNLCIENHLDISEIYSPKQRFFQDWIAPFYLYLQAKSNLRYTMFDDDIQSPKIRLEGDVAPNLTLFKKALFEFRLEFEHAQIATFSYTKNNKTISASCSSN